MPSPTRRAFLGGVTAPLVARQPRRPNIILIVTDDQRYDALSCHDKPGILSFLKTPNMDRLAGEGVRFHNAFVTTSLCSPSRASILSGKYVHTHGVYALAGDLKPDCAIFPALLKQAGYETGFAGKWHLGVESEVPHPAFDDWAAFRSQGEYFNPLLNINGKPAQTTGYVTDLLTDRALEFIGRRHDKPFFFMLSHKAPHHAVEPPKHLRRLYEDVRVPLPSTYSETLDDKPRWFVEGSNHDYFHMLLHPRDKYEKYVKDYCRTLVSVDQNLGRLLKLLEEKGLDRDTAIFLMGDNGHFFGEHQLYTKMLMYEESIRVPMLARYPALGQAGVKRDEMVLNVDVAPTILDLAGVPVPKDMEGRSFGNLVRGRNNPGWRQSFRYEYFAAAGWGVPSIEGVRTAGGWKYVRHADWEQLFNLNEDPEEVHNLANSAAHARKKAELVAELKRLGGGGKLEPARPYKRKDSPVHLPHGADFR